MRVGFAATRVKNETCGEKEPDAQIRFDCLIGLTFFRTAEFPCNESHTTLDRLTALRSI